MDIEEEEGVLIIDDPVVERFALQCAEDWGVSVEEAILMALTERFEARQRQG